jgi:hypothetical protein
VNDNAETWSAMWEMFTEPIDRYRVYRAPCAGRR